jgi:hypothetical protein
MRTLIYVPVIHTGPDLGSMAKDVTERGIADLGETFWKMHQKTIDRYWEKISSYLDSLDVLGMKIYQDGLLANREMGQKIVEEGVKSGSKNFEIILKLLKRGAILVRTEDLMLVKKEHDMILAIIQAKPTIKKFIAVMKYKLIKNRLLIRRDKFIAQRIKKTLNSNERGIIFIGAYHKIKRKLPKDIQVKEIKDPEKVREYHKLLRSYLKNKKRFEQLARYIVSEIKDSEGLTFIEP